MVKMIRERQCDTCKFYASAGRCDAFPEGIPRAILTNAHDHREPYDGDGGIRFEPIAATPDEDDSDQ